MPRVSTIKNIFIDEAKAAHDCSLNKKHRIRRGDKRLNIKNKRSPKRYCIGCSLSAIIKDIEKLNELKIKAEKGVTSL